MTTGNVRLHEATEYGNVFLPVSKRPVKIAELNYVVEVADDTHDSSLVYTLSPCMFSQALSCIKQTISCRRIYT